MARKPDVQYIRFYTDGSAARKVAPAAPLKTIKLPRLKKQKKLLLYIDPVAIAGIAMAVIMLTLMAVGVMQLRTARQELQAMTAYVSTLQEENESLQAAFSENCDLDQIKETALALGLVPKDQVKHVTVSVPELTVEETPDAWERFYIFLTGLFA